MAHDPDELLGELRAILCRSQRHGELFLRNAQSALLVLNLPHELFGPLARVDQFLLVAMAILRHRQRQLVERLFTMLTPDGIHHHRDRISRPMEQVQLDLRDRPLHLQQRRPVRLVKDPAPHGQQILDSPDPDERRPVDSEPRAQCVVRFEDEPLGVGQRNTARSVFEQIVITRQPGTLVEEVSHPACG